MCSTHGMQANAAASHQESRLCLMDFWQAFRQHRHVPPESGQKIHEAKRHNIQTPLLPAGPFAPSILMRSCAKATFGATAFMQVSWHMSAARCSVAQLGAHQQQQEVSAGGRLWQPAVIPQVQRLCMEVEEGSTRQCMQRQNAGEAGMVPSRGCHGQKLEYCCDFHLVACCAAGMGTACRSC